MGGGWINDRENNTNNYNNKLGLSWMFKWMTKYMTKYMNGAQTVCVLGPEEMPNLVWGGASAPQLRLDRPKT